MSSQPPTYDVVFYPLFVSFVFLSFNLLILLAIRALERRRAARPAQPPPAHKAPGEQFLDASQILGWEFDFARMSAIESMQDRNRIINYYFLLVGALVSGAAVLPRVFATPLLWLLCGVGWAFFLLIIRLRGAFHDSLKAMARIKEFYFLHAKDIASDDLRAAFRWQDHRIPSPDQPWNMFFYSAMIIGFLDSAAYVLGGALLDPIAAQSFPWLFLGPLALFGFVFFVFHLWMYFAFLR